MKDGRLYALDLARFMAMVFMMQGHVLDALVSPQIIDVAHPPWSVWHWIRGFTAPVFLMVSGAVHVFASKRGDDGTIKASVLAKRIRWAITIMGLGYLMFFPASRLWDLPFLGPAEWAQFLSVNILQLTGVTLLVFVLVMARTHSAQAMGRVGLATGLVILALTPIVSSPSVVSAVPAWIAAYLTFAKGSLFPFFPFGAYLFLGVTLGAYLHGIPGEGRDRALVRVGLTVGTGIAAMAFGIHHVLLANGIDGPMLESPQSVLLVVRRVGIVLLIFSGSVWVLHRTYRLREWYVLFGTRSLYIYVIHLLLLYGSPWWDGIGRTSFRQFDLASGLGILAIIMASTLVMAWGIDRYERSKIRPEIKAVVRWSAMATLAWLLLT